MRSFYLSKNDCGYYRVNFIDPITGKKLSPKSTHTKDKIEATMIATKWLQFGVPCSNANSRLFDSELKGEKVSELKFNSAPVPTQKALSTDLESFVDSLSENDIDKLISLLAQKRPSLSNSEISTPLASPQNEIKSPKISLPLASYMTDFWDHDRSQYLAEEKAYGREIGLRHAKDMRGIVARYWVPYFGEERELSDIDILELEEFFLYLRQEKGLSGTTVNHIISCGSKVFKYLARKGLVDKNPIENLSRFSTDQIQRGIPTESEVSNLLKADWRSEADYLAFNIAAFCGLRAGEISGLRTCDIDLDADIIHVRHSWGSADGLKTTKNTDTRDIPTDHETVLGLMNLARKNKLFSDTSFVFWSTKKPEQPFWADYFQEGFYDALYKIGVSEEQRRERNIVFHSLRHFCATMLRQRTNLETVKSILGHRTSAMTEHYSAHASESQQAAIKKAMCENKDFILKMSAA